MYKEKIENLQNQRKTLKAELNEYEDAVLNREQLLNKVDVALEVLVSLQNEEDSKEKDKKDKKDKN